MILRKVIVAVLAGCWMGVALAVEVSESEARQAVRGWLRQRPTLTCQMGTEPESVSTYPGNGGVGRFHVVSLKGGGLVVTTSDRSLPPILAFSPENDWVASEANPLWSLITRDVADRTRALKRAGARTMAATPNPNEARWAALLADQPMLAGLDSVSDLRIAPLLQSQWNQLTHNNYSNGKNCFNYYTPNNDPCGCVATAGSQVMRYHCYPTQAVTPATYDCEVDGVATSLTMMGGTYDWEKMPLRPAQSTPTDEQCQAIGKLTYDVGISCLMSYTDYSGSAPCYMLAKRFVDRFRYANALSAIFYDGGYPYTAERGVKAILPNLDARLPVILSVHNDTYGHAVVADGYGYSGGDLYLHINMGWGGVTDAWYRPPDIDEYTAISAIVYNIYPTQTANGTIVSGRVLDAGGVPVGGITVTALKGSGTQTASTTTDAKGIYALILPAANYTLRASGDGITATTSVSVKAGVGSKMTSDGSYYLTPATISNLWGVDLTLPALQAVAMPTCTPDPGTTVFIDPITVTLACSTSGAEIHYTLDGTEPTQSSPRYTAPISLSETTTVKARGFLTNFSPSEILTVTFSFPPRYDYFADAKPISGLSGSETLDIDGFTLETGEPRHRSNYSQYRSAWFRWVSPGNGSITFSGSCKRVTTSGSTITTTTIPTYLSVYTGTAVNALTRVKEGDYSNKASSATLDVTTGTVYYIGVATGTDTIGDLTMSWSAVPSFALYTLTTEIPVPYTWLETWGLVTGNDYEAAGWADTDGDGFDNWAEYLCNSDPKNPASYLRMTGITVIDGVGIPAYLPDTSPYATFVLEGTETLLQPQWGPVRAGHRFFRVRAVPK